MDDGSSPAIQWFLAGRLPADDLSPDDRAHAAHELDTWLDYHAAARVLLADQLRAARERAARARTLTTRDRLPIGSETSADDAILGISAVVTPSVPVEALNAAAREMAARYALALALRARIDLRHSARWFASDAKKLNDVNETAARWLSRAGWCDPFADVGGEDLSAAEDWLAGTTSAPLPPVAEAVVVFVVAAELEAAVAQIDTIDRATAVPTARRVALREVEERIAAERSVAVASTPEGRALAIATALANGTASPDDVEQGDTAAVVHILDTSIERYRALQGELKEADVVAQSRLERANALPVADPLAVPLTATEDDIRSGLRAYGGEIPPDGLTSAALGVAALLAVGERLSAVAVNVRFADLLVENGQAWARAIAAERGQRDRCLAERILQAQESAVQWLSRAELADPFMTLSDRDAAAALAYLDRRDSGEALTPLQQQAAQTLAHRGAIRIGLPLAEIPGPLARMEAARTSLQLILAKNTADIDRGPAV